MEVGYLKFLGAFLLGMIASFCKQYGLVIALVLVLIVMDCITGLIKAKVTGEKWDSKKGTKGFWKKMALICALFFGVALDAVIPFVLQLGLDVSLPFNAPFGLIVGAYIILNESISICENLYAANQAIIPGWIVRLLKIAGNAIDAGNDKEEKQHESMD